MVSPETFLAIFQITKSDKKSPRIEKRRDVSRGFTPSVDVRKIPMKRLRKTIAAISIGSSISVIKIFLGCRFMVEGKLKPALFNHLMP